MWIYSQIAWGTSNKNNIKESQNISRNKLTAISFPEFSGRLAKLTAAAAAAPEEIPTYVESGNNYDKTYSKSKNLIANTKQKMKVANPITKLNLHPQYAHIKKT